MKLYRDLTALPQTAKGAVVAIGNFDGLHEGHKAVLAEARAQAMRLNAPLAVMSFEPHPRRVFNPDLPPLRLFPVNQKLRLLRDAGIDVVYLIRFSHSFARLTAQDFCQQVLQQQCAAKHVVTGAGFRYGYKREGNAAMLAEFGQAYGFTTSPVKPLTLRGDYCSSTRIREALSIGDLKLAAECLGRDYSMTSRVLHGEKRGRELGFPTANIAPLKLYNPRFGVYAVTLTDESGICHKAVANFGIRPMYPLTRPLLEVHCLDSTLDLYGQKVVISFKKWLRDEMAFDNEAGLITQMTLDTSQARQLLEAAS